MKAGTPKAFLKKTGAKPEAFEIPFQAIRNLLDFNVRFHVAGMMDDPRIVTQEERMKLVRRLVEIDPKLVVTFEGELFIHMIRP